MKFSMLLSLFPIDVLGPSAADFILIISMHEMKVGVCCYFGHWLDFLAGQIVLILLLNLFRFILFQIIS